MKSTHPQMRIRLPHDIKRWLEKNADRNMRTQNAEIILALREVMAAGISPRQASPAANVSKTDETSLENA